MREILSMDNYDTSTGKIELSNKNTNSNKDELETIKTQMLEMATKHENDMRKLHIKSESTIVELQCKLMHLT